MLLVDWVKEVFGGGGRLGRRPDDEEFEAEVPGRPPPTPTTRPIPKPKDTPTSRPLGATGSTAGTPSYRSPRDTPSTQRIHNPAHWRD